MKRLWTSLLCLLLCTSLSGSAQAVTIYTASCFAGADTAAEAYVELLRSFEEQTGHVVSDDSATSDEAWKTSILYDFAAGNEPDLLFFFAASADSAPLLSRVVPISEINAAYPDLHLTEDPVLTESDGQIYAIPVRSYWEGLYVNVDLFQQYDIELPTDWDKFETAIRRFREEGVVPISISLSDIPHYLAELAILASGTAEEYTARPQDYTQVPPSWISGMDLIRKLYQMGAFPDNVMATTEDATSQMFRQKKAAMQLDGSWFAGSIPLENMDTTMVLPLPVKAQRADSHSVIGGVSMGFYLTRRAWEDPMKRDAAVSLLSYLTQPDSVDRLAGYNLSGLLLTSYHQILDQADQLLPPIQDAMSKEARETWLLECVSSVALGTLSPESCWRKVMALHPFQ